MSVQDVLLQQVINGVSLGAMYALLALGFTMVYGIIELINFAHFNVSMVGSFIAMAVLEAVGLTGQQVILTGLPLVGVLVLALVATMLSTGVLGVLKVPAAFIPWPAALEIWMSTRSIPTSSTARPVTTIRPPV